MSFTFNWAGVQGVTPVQVKDRDMTVRSDAAAWGSALRGYERRKADEEYAGILDKQRRVNEIKARIQQLESRNAEIRSQMSTITPQTVQPAQQYQPGPAFVSTPEHPTPSNYPYANNLG